MGRWTSAELKNGEEMKEEGGETERGWGEKKERREEDREGEPY